LRACVLNEIHNNYATYLQWPLLKRTFTSNGILLSGQISDEVR